MVDWAALPLGARKPVSEGALTTLTHCRSENMADVSSWLTPRSAATSARKGTR